MRCLKRHSLAVPEHPLQRQIADALRLEIAPPGKVSRDGVVWWSVDHAAYAGVAPGARVGRGIVAGIPDTFMLWQGRAYLVEIKGTRGRIIGSAAVGDGGAGERWPGWRGGQC
jgi:hypothetical protein